MFKYDNDKSSLHLPLLPLRDIVVYPHMVAPLFVGRTQSVNALTEAMNKEKQIFLATQKSAGIDDPKEKDISSVGTIGNVLQLLRLPDGTVKALVEGKQRGQIKRFIPNEDYFQVEIEMLTDGSISKAESVALMRAVNEAFEEYAKQNTNISKDLISNVAAITDPSQLADTVSAHFSFKLEDKQKLLEIRSLTERLSLLLRLIKMEIEIFRMDKRIKGRVKDQMEKTQRNYYLNEQMRAIRKEMGAEDEAADELNELEKRIQKKRMSKEAAAKVHQEFKKLKFMTPMSAEATVVRNYIEWLIGLPWFDRSKVRTDIEEAEKILNEDHFGLEKPKERILEYLAVQSLVKKNQGSHSLPCGSSGCRENLFGKISGQGHRKKICPAVFGRSS
jgi:ATP-dependent Lon protease